MAVTVAKITNVTDTIWGNKRVKVRNVTFDSAYVQTGEPVNASDFGLATFDTLEPLGAAIPTAGTTAWLVTAQISSDRKSAVLFAHGDGSQTATAPFLDADASEDLSTYSVVMRAVGV